MRWSVRARVWLFPIQVSLLSVLYSPPLSSSPCQKNPNSTRHHHTRTITVSTNHSPSKSGAQSNLYRHPTSSILSFHHLLSTSGTFCIKCTSSGARYTCTMSNQHDGNIPAA